MTGGAPLHARVKPLRPFGKALAVFRAAPTELSVTPRICGIL